MNIDQAGFELGKWRFYVFNSLFRFNLETKEVYDMI